MTPGAMMGFCTIRSLPSACHRRVVSKLGQSLPPPINVARNSHAFTSNVDSTSLELQRFRVVSKSDRGKLRAKFVWRLSGLRPRVPWLAQCLEARPCSPDPPPSAPGCISGCRWGFCTIRSLPSACRRRVAPLLVQFPPSGGALDVGRARPWASHGAIPPVCWR